MTDTWHKEMSRFGYSVERWIGEGGFSKVYLIRELRTGQEFAGKVSSHLDMLRKEFEILQRIQHPMFPRAVDFWSFAGMAVMRMEYIHGITLGSFSSCRQTPKQFGRGQTAFRQSVHGQVGLQAQILISIGIQLAEGMSYLQRLHPPLIYRDLKPENIMVEKNGGMRLLDFGCALELGQHDFRTAGTPGFAAPEQLKGGEVGLSADVYGLGKTLEHILDKRDHSREAQRLRKILALCTQTEIEKRPPDMEAVLGLFKGRSTKDYPRWKKNVREFEFKKIITVLE